MPSFCQTSRILFLFVFMSLLSSPLQAHEKASGPIAIGVEMMDQTEEDLANNIISGEQEICAGSTTNILIGSSPTGGSGPYRYQWQMSTNGPTIDFVPAYGNNTGKNYLLYGPLTRTTWFRRVVISNNVSILSNAIRISVLSEITNNILLENQTVCEGEMPNTIRTTIPTGGSGEYTYGWELSTLGPETGFEIIPDAHAPTFTPSALQETTWFRRKVYSGTCPASISLAIEIKMVQKPETPTIELESSNLMVASSSASSYEWSLNGQVLKEATLQTLLATTPGEYRVRAFNEQGCASTLSEPFSLTVTGSKEEGPLAEMKLYPNPAAHIITLLPATYLADLHFSITTTSGQVLFSKNYQHLHSPQPLNIQFLAPGLYLVHLKSAEFQSTRRLVVAR